MIKQQKTTQEIYKTLLGKHPNECPLAAYVIYHDITNNKKEKLWVLPYNHSKDDLKRVYKKLEEFNLPKDGAFLQRKILLEIVVLYSNHFVVDGLLNAIKHSIKIKNSYVYLSLDTIEMINTQKVDSSWALENLHRDANLLRFINPLGV